MNKRQWKKLLNQEIKKKSIFQIKNVQGKNLLIYISKRHWNKGNNEIVVFCNQRKDYISGDYLLQKGIKYILFVGENCQGHIDIRKSWDNKNHLVVR